MSSNEYASAEDYGRRTEIYNEDEDDDGVLEEYEILMEATRDFDFDKSNDILAFDTEYGAKFGTINQSHGTFLHFWAKSPPTTPPPPPRFGKWLFSKRPGMIEKLDKDKRTPVHLALDRKSADAKEFLNLVVEECPNATLIKVLAQKDVGGHNCLHYAIRRNFPWTLDLIRICQAETQLFTTGNNDDQTPLHLAMAPPRTKQQQTRVTRRRQADVKKPEQPEAVASANGMDDVAFKERKLREKEMASRNREAVNKVEPTSESKNKVTSSKDPSQTPPVTHEQSTNSLSSVSDRSLSLQASFPFQEVVQSLMKCGTEALWQTDSKGKTPYQLRLQLMSEKKNLSVKDGAMSRAVNEDLVARDMKEFCLRNLGRSDAMKSLYEKGKEKHIEFDLSGLPSSSISKLDLERLARHLTFEDTLQYVAIPKLRVKDPFSEKAHESPPAKTENQDESKDPSSGSKPPSHPEGLGLSDARIIFKWLADRNVSRIFKVIVVDDSDTPHSNQVIEDALRDFKIETWDWKKVDICSDTILEAAAGVRFVNLYASGNSAVLKGWSCPDGLVKLKSLEKVRLIIRPGFETEKRRGEDVAKFTADFQANWATKYKKSIKDAPEVEPVWDDKVKSLTSWIQSDKAPDEKQRWLEHMDTFASFIACIDLKREKRERAILQDIEEKARRPKEKRTKPLEDIKVAIIDDGVDGFDPTVSQSIANGVSFCRPLDSADLVRSYYVSSGGHGTMMARLILRMCPTAKLYVARLQEYTAAVGGKRFVTAESATDAVKWATTNGVQIISMSWTIEGNKNEPRIANLKKAIDLAKSNNISMMSAFSDQGMSSPPERTFPTAWKDECCRIGAATSGGDASTLVPKSQVDFLFPGENIVIDAEPSLSNPSPRAESGSSISTALAAGTAAMLLFITQLVNAALYEKLKDPKTMKLALERLVSANNTQYFDAPRFSLSFGTPEWSWDQAEYRTGRGWDEVKKLVEHFVKMED